MKKISFLYYGGDSIGRFLICARLSSVFSHCAIEMDGEIYQSTLANGVHKLPKSQVKGHIAKQTISVSDEEFEKAKARAESLLDTSYDYSAIVGFFCGSLKQSKDNWFCSEYGRVVFEEATGIKIPLFNLLTPGQLRLIVETYNKMVDKG